MRGEGCSATIRVVSLYPRTENISGNDLRLYRVANGGDRRCF
jgi:hypothetical protein